MESGLLLLRVVLGGIMAAHGAQKLFGWFGGPGLTGTAGWVEQMGMRPARAHAVVSGLAEFGGGLLVAFGLLTPLGAAAVAGVMFVAIATVHWKNGFFNSNGGFEFNLLIVAASIGLAFTGPGRISIDHVTGWSLAGPGWGIAALGIAAAAAVAVLAVRKRPLEPAREAPSHDEVAAA